MQLIIGVLFVSISATVTPTSLSHLVLPTLGLVAVLVLITRPLMAFLATFRRAAGVPDDLSWSGRPSSRQMSSNAWVQPPSGRPSTTRAGWRRGPTVQLSPG